MPSRSKPAFGTPLVKAPREGPPTVWTYMVQATHPTRFTVLLGNQQEGWHDHVRRLLEPQGVQTLSAHSGHEALQLIERQPIHVAVLDTQMPQLGGLQVVRMMRELHKADPGRASKAPPAI